MTGLRVDWAKPRSRAVLYGSDIDQVSEFMKDNVKRDEVVQFLAEVNDVKLVTQACYEACKKFDYVTPMEFASLIDSVMGGTGRLVSSDLPDQWGVAEWGAVCDAMQTFMDKPELHNPDNYQPAVTLAAMYQYKHSLSQK